MKGYYILLKLKKAATAAFAVCLLLSLPFTLSAAGGAGTADDPLVTYSYINGTFRNQLKNEIKKELVSEFSGTGSAPQITESLKEELKAEIMAELLAQQSGPDSGFSAYAVERLTEGQKLVAKDACEIILRSGGAVVFVESEENINAGLGLSDCTDGSEIKNGQAVPARHLLIIPRGDGRGVTVTTAEAYIMVRGEYQIINKFTG